uniref:Uncharacterized protein n=1 Tax=Trypanosoma congolense (strain IL3000) TaxID=1068625 RepID=G0UN50_TRYCI|nr:hypothetical protein TCIL3000_6_360 [Trypanosoma congolense IL3000]
MCIYGCTSDHFIYVHFEGWKRRKKTSSLQRSRWCNSRCNEWVISLSALIRLLPFPLLIIFMDYLLFFLILYILLFLLSFPQRLRNKINQKKLATAFSLFNIYIYIYKEKIIFLTYIPTGVRWVINRLMGVFTQRKTETTTRPCSETNKQTKTGVLLVETRDEGVNQSN